MAEKGIFGTLLGMQLGARMWQAPLLQSPHMQVFKWQVCSWWLRAQQVEMKIKGYCVYLSLSTPPSIARRQGQFVEATEQW